MNNLNLILPETSDKRLAASFPPIGRVLLDQGKIGPADLDHALGLQRRIDAPLGDIMVAEGLIKKADVLAALAVQACTEPADLDLAPPREEMAHLIRADLCLRHGVVPWKVEDRALYVATGSPAGFQAFSRDMGQTDHSLFPVIVDGAQIRAQQNRLYGTELARQAELRVPAEESCRIWEGNGGSRRRWCLIVLACLTIVVAIAPVLAITLLSLLATLSLVMVSLLKLAALAAHLVPEAATRKIAQSWLEYRRKFRPSTPRSSSAAPELVPVDTLRTDAALRIAGAMAAFKSTGLPSINAQDRRFRLPRVSVLVPLLKEREIAGQLIARLAQLTYPKSLLEVILVLEANDTVTRDTIARTDLPNWMSVIEVPQGDGLTTKPRALNYALNFCKGSIIGVWDAEDWPEADQIEKVAARFHSAPERVVCLQGILDYYNSRSSWLARCFAIEYAVWWRVVMPGIARLGLVVPLGGTTLFFRRRALEDLGGWDAHNVTEDADLGVRLARHGYKTELLPTVTREEATNRAWPWIRQRSRWLKGFLVTYLVHMRNPRALLRDLGLWRFMGLQAMLLAAFFQFAAAPVLWSFWMTLAGLKHPVATVLGSGTFWALALIFLAAEALSLALGAVAIRGRAHRHLFPVLPTMTLYFTLGTVAAYKALWELIHVPFYWDKTQHGPGTSTDPAPASPIPIATTLPEHSHGSS